MTSSSLTWTEETAQVGGADLHIFKGGSGEPLVVLHDELGQVAPLRYADDLSRNFTIHMPGHPGYGLTDRLDWIMNMRDLASWYLRALEELGLERVNVLGLSMGGWLAAEMACQSPQIFKKMALVAPPGIKPPEGEILDMFLIVAKEYMEASYLDPANTREFTTVCPEEASPEQVELWEVAREESCRLAWRPYMYNQALPHLLGRLKDLPTLLVWGEQDAVVPVSTGKAYEQAIQGARLEIISGSGHHPEIEKTEEFVGLAREFFA